MGSQMNFLEEEFKALEKEVERKRKLRVDMEMNALSLGMNSRPLSPFPFHIEKKSKYRDGQCGAANDTD